jgi:hypothetical protein
VNLPQVRLGWVFSDAGTMLHGRAGVSIPFDADSLDEGDCIDVRFAESVLTVTTDGDDRCCCRFWVHKLSIPRLMECLMECLMKF